MTDAAAPTTSEEDYNKNDLFAVLENTKDAFNLDIVYITEGRIIYFNNLFF